MKPTSSSFLVMIGSLLVTMGTLPTSTTTAFVTPQSPLLSNRVVETTTSTSTSTTESVIARTLSSSSASSTTCLGVATEVSGGLQDAWTAYNDALQASPLLVKSVTASVILGAADIAGQAIQNADNNNNNNDEDVSIDTGLDVARTIRFAFFGLVLQAPWNHFYYLLLDGAIPPTEEPFTTTTGIKVVIDQFVQAPIFTVLIFAFLGFLEGKNAEDIKEQLNDDYADTMVANWKLWVPATVVNIAFVPPILRVLYLNCVFFFWSIFLSLKLNKDETVDV